MKKFKGPSRIKKPCINRECRFLSFKKREEKLQPLIADAFRAINENYVKIDVIEKEEIEIDDEYVEFEANIKEEMKIDVIKKEVIDIDDDYTEYGLNMKEEVKLE